MDDKTIRREYLGEGVYAEYGDGELLIRTGRHDNPEYITLDGYVYNNLLRFVSACQGR